MKFTNLLLICALYVPLQGAVLQENNAVVLEGIKITPSQLRSNSTYDLTSAINKLTETYFTTAKPKAPEMPKLSPTGEALYKSIGVLSTRVAQKDTRTEELVESARNIKNQLVVLFRTGQWEEFKYLTLLYMTYIPESNPQVSITKNDIPALTNLSSLLGIALSRIDLAAKYEAAYGKNSTTELLTYRKPISQAPTPLTLKYLSSNFKEEHPMIETSDWEFIAYVNQAEQALPLFPKKSQIQATNLLDTNAYSALKVELFTYYKATQDPATFYVLSTLTSLDRFYESVKNPAPVVKVESSFTDPLKDLNAQLAARKVNAAPPALTTPVESLVNRSADFASVESTDFLQDAIIRLIKNKDYAAAGLLIDVYHESFKASTTSVYRLSEVAAVQNFLKKYASTADLQQKVAEVEVAFRTNFEAFQQAYRQGELVTATQYLYNSYALYPTHPDLQKLPKSIREQFQPVAAALKDAKLDEASLKARLLELNNNVAPTLY